MDTQLFKGWLTDHFLQFAVSARPLLLLLDGLSSHFQPELIQYAKDHDIIVFCLPPHTTHESQPLDASVFRSLKQHWQDVSHSYMQSNPGKLITKYNFSPLLNQAWSKTMTPSTICSGFRRCGVYPFNPNAIDCRLTAEEGEESILSVQRVVKTIQPLGVRMKITELLKTAGEGRVVDLYPQTTCTLIPMQIRQILKRRSSTKGALKRGTTFMILSILSGWKETIRSLYLPSLVAAAEQQPSVSECFSHITPMQPIDQGDDPVDSEASAPQISGKDTESNAAKVAATPSMSSTLAKPPELNKISASTTTPTFSDLSTISDPSGLLNCIQE